MVIRRHFQQAETPALQGGSCSEPRRCQLGEAIIPQHQQHCGFPPAMQQLHWVVVQVGFQKGSTGPAKPSEVSQRSAVGSVSSAAVGFSREAALQPARSLRLEEGGHP